jgi:hypothetical protein
LTDFAVEAVKGVGVENALLARTHLKKHFLKAVGSAACKPEIFREKSSRQGPSKVQSGRLPPSRMSKAWGVSIGEMVAQQKRQEGER